MIFVLYGHKLCGGYLKNKKSKRRSAPAWVIRYAPTFVYTKYVSWSTQPHLASPNIAILVFIGGREDRVSRILGPGPRAPGKKQMYKKQNWDYSLRS